MAQLSHETTSPTLVPIDAVALRRDFPIFSEIEQEHFIYLDSASSSQKPDVVIDAMSHYYHTTHANIHRGAYRIAAEATALFEESRVLLGQLIGARKPALEVAFTKNATEAFNLFAQGYGRTVLGPGDVVLLTEMEHHANIVPWMILRDQLGFELRYIPIDGEGKLILDNLDSLLLGVKIVGVTLVSNVLGTINPITYITERAHAVGAVVIGDGAQAAPHLAIDVQRLGLDALTITGHKMLGPTGIGALWAREEILTQMLPFLGGGEMISDVSFEHFAPAAIPHKFEAGTQPIAETVGLAAAVRYLRTLGFDNVREHELSLIRYAIPSLRERFGDRITIFGPSNPEDRSGVISFHLEGIHPHDISQVLDQEGVCIRAGQHCARPLMKRLKVAATARASFYIYNDEADVDALVSALSSAEKFFR